MYDEKIKDLFLYGDLNPPIMSILQRRTEKAIADLFVNVSAAFTGLILCTFLKSSAVINNRFIDPGALADSLLLKALIRILTKKDPRLILPLCCWGMAWP